MEPCICPPKSIGIKFLAVSKASITQLYHKQVQGDALTPEATKGLTFQIASPYPQKLSR